MTTDLERLSEALKKDTPEKLLEQKIEENRREIIDTLEQGQEYNLDGLVIKRL
jgi:hypothetical protein